MSEPAQRREPRPAGTFKLGTIAGSDVLVSSSWFLIAALIAFLMAPRVEQVQPGLGPWKYVAGLTFAVVLYGSVLLHEASHAVVARRYGFQVTSITLHFLGGMTAIQGESRTPRQEFWIAVVGPLTSIAVGLAALGLWFITPDGLLLMAVEGLAGANLLVGVLNLVPGLPLDGGRVLKSAVWRVTGDVHRGTIAAAWGGRVTAFVVLLWPLVQEQVFGRPPDIFDFVLSFVIATFLWAGATQAMTSARVRSRLPLLRARDLARRTLSVPGDLPLAEAVRRAQVAEAGSIVTVTGSGKPVGVVNEAALLATPEERRPWVAVSTVARTLEDGLSIPVGLSGEELIQAIQRAPAAEYVLVEEDGTVYGVLATADVDRAVRL
ncbi:peptidase M50 [Nocardioides psychrotolerans]|uniref:Zinc metalloprotease n=1 Tax=Nocardioides psychrotolerans TaxID=1005945 RepID=A0A1I3K186_9ACTN|nr:site-2 protease family protein [Nocardioides psychrotolerans]GEP38386.1 peptidase M50 [Nocardioides psychrotolerans]SFI66196.1 Zn-dependent protease (includes SpoIVFB) [Nocardioides psychrotolerans]